MVACFRFPREHRIHLRTTNPVESPFAPLRRRTAAAKRFKRVDNATAVIWKLLMVAERNFRRLNAAKLLAEVCSGAEFVNGVVVESHQEEAAARNASTHLSTEAPIRKRSF